MPEKEKGDEVTLDELPVYIEFIESALNGSIVTKTKNKDKVIREFDADKWGSLLEYFSDRNKKVTVHDVDNQLRKRKPGLFPVWDGASFILDDKKSASERMHQHLYGLLSRYVGSATSLVELGAGYGSNFFKLAVRTPFSQLKLGAGELTESGVSLMKVIADDIGVEVDVGICDIYNGEMSGFEIKPNALIYTAYAMCYRRYLDEKFVEYLSSHKPRYVVHFEPVFEHMSKKSLHGLMCRKYMESNGYTENLLSVLKSSEKNGDIEIVEERKLLFGINPLLPFSLLVWRPK